MNTISVQQNCSATGKGQESDCKLFLFGQGLMLAGCMVDNMVIGGPADLCDVLDKGDKIVTVDGQPVTVENVRFWL